MARNPTSAAIPAAVDTRTDAEREAEETAAAAARDEQGAQLVSAEGDGAIVTGDTVLTPTETPVLEGEAEDWSDVLIVAGAPSKMPTKGDRKVIVTEARSQPDEEGKNAGQFRTDATYPKGADAYVGHAQVDEEGEARRIFPDAAEKPVFLIGQNLKQFGLGGVSRQPGYVSVGPGSSVIAAVNLALLHGAKKVEIVGLTDYDKGYLGQWLDKIAHEFEELSY